MPPRKKVKTDALQEGPTAGLRRSTRTSSKASNAASANTPPDIQPPVTSVVKLRRGCLKDIPNFAIEIQLMIFGHLHPQDLFNLSRMAKLFHGFFLHRSNEALWEAALKNAEDLPERPQWMSIPSFIHLLYSTHCHNCGCPNIRKVEWPWFAWYCSKCLSKVTYESGDAFHQLSGVGCSIRVVDVLDSVEVERTDATSRTSTALLANGPLFPSLGTQPPEMPFTPNVAMIFKFGESTPSVAKNGTISLKNTARKACGMDGKIASLHEYHNLDVFRIVKKLTETGWKQDLDFLGPYGLEWMSRLPVVRQSGKLTDKEWEKVQTALHTFLDETRSERLKKERSTLIKERFAELDKALLTHCVTIPRDMTMDCRPVALDLALQAELEPVANAPSSETVTQETFAAIVPQLVTSWKAEQRQALQLYLRQFITAPVPHGVNVLDLAIAIFYPLPQYSLKEVQRLRYPYLLSLPFFRDNCAGWRDFTDSHYASPARPNSNSRPCDPRQLQHKAVEVGIKWMRKIVTALGLDPDTATFADLEQCEARLRCLKYAKTKGKDCIYTWESAFAHTADNDTTSRYSRNKYPRSVHHRWSLVKKAEMPKVKECEAVAHALTVDSDCVWSCALCVDWKGRGKGGKVREHLISEHNIADANGAVDDGTIFWSPIHNKLKKPAVQL
ncbi:hypothetical protein GSI_12722 [Ganoderma sinense ZZ0214-1]|uniref:F-box domain-containing protein n=1 Tax=Ganoderma sinense ZZ0214-1 TaxID=1077348 RepID=A0A2G8RTK1_9APHY|nr:hypothetical protein GSI_12722 [Ganoderma sinense ZZ0214-1]